MKKKNIIIKFSIFIFLLVITNILLFIMNKDIFMNPQKIPVLLLNYEYDQVLFIILVVLQVIVSMIPGQVIGLAGGFLYGPFWGTVYSMTGLIIGSSIAFLLSKKLGRPFVKNYLGKEKINKYDKFMIKNGKLSLFLIFLFPALPDDLICFIAGVSKIKLKTFLIVAFLGRLPGFIVLNFIGAEILEYSLKMKFSIFFILLVISIIFIKYKNSIENYFKKIIKKIM